MSGPEQRVIHGSVADLVSDDCHTRQGPRDAFGNAVRDVTAKQSKDDSLYEVTACIDASKVKFQMPIWSRVESTSGDVRTGRHAPRPRRRRARGLGASRVAALNWPSHRLGNEAIPRHDQEATTRHPS